MVSCPEGACECPACLVEMVLNNELVFFRSVPAVPAVLVTGDWCWCVYQGSLLHRKFSDPGSRRPEPRLHYYRLKVFQDAVRTDIDEQ